MKNTVKNINELIFALKELSKYHPLSFQGTLEAKDNFLFISVYGHEKNIGIAKVSGNFSKNSIAGIDLEDLLAFLLKNKDSKSCEINFSDKKVSVKTDKNEAFFNSEFDFVFKDVIDTYKNQNYIGEIGIIDANKFSEDLEALRINHLIGLTLEDNKKKFKGKLILSKKQNILYNLDIQSIKRIIDVAKKNEEIKVFAHSDRAFHLQYKSNEVLFDLYFQNEMGFIELEIKNDYFNGIRKYGAVVLEDYLLENQEIINFILKNATLLDVQEAINQRNIALVGYKMKVKLAGQFPDVFKKNGRFDELNFGLIISDVFEPYKTNQVEMQEVEKELSNIQKWLSVHPNYHSDYAQKIKEHDELADRQNELNKPIAKFMKDYQKAQKENGRVIKIKNNNTSKNIKKPFEYEQMKKKMGKMMKNNSDLDKKPSIAQRIADLKIILELDESDEKIKQRIADLELIDSL